MGLQQSRTLYEAVRRFADRDEKTNSMGGSSMPPSMSTAVLVILFCGLWTSVNAAWSDTNADGQNDTWTDPSSQAVTTLQAMNAQGVDVDNDGATNTEEAAQGSNPYAIDTDQDGLTDGDELHVVRLTIPGASLTNWDSDGDLYSDYDEYHSFFGVKYLGGVLPAISGASFSDYDGDGFKNPVDPAPKDPDNTAEVYYIPSGEWGYEIPYKWYGAALGDADGDGIVNFDDLFPFVEDDDDNDGIPDSIDPSPGDYMNLSAINGLAWDYNAMGDMDGDGILNWWDPQNDSPFGDIDGDGIANQDDPAPEDPLNFSAANGMEWGLDYYADNDGDGIRNWWDPLPYQPSADADGDGIFDQYDPMPEDSQNYSSINGITWYADVNGDIDGDGALNWEDASPYGLDSDGDGLYDYQELQYGSDLYIVDTDGDGLTDYEEVMVYYTSPTNPYGRSQSLGWGNFYKDSDLVDQTDTDGDYIPDKIELFYGLNINDSSDGWGDLDSNGIPNYYQYWSGTALDLGLSVYDADGDGMTDVFELAYGLNPDDPGDAILDGDDDGVLNYEEGKLGLSPIKTNTLGGQFENWRNFDIGWMITRIFYPADDAPTEDSDSDGIPDWGELALAGLNPTFTRVAEGDLDGDGMPDSWEHQYGRWKYPANGMDLRRNDAELDADGDGLKNIQEYQFGTHPLAADSDGDGIMDGAEDLDNDGLTSALELLLGFNPLIADSDHDGNDDGESIPPNDPDRDGQLTAEEISIGTNPAWKDHPAVGLKATGSVGP
ncbi:hypothetical protein [Verrucomicrobium sp. BvORR034]|uniref:hypothetical protein n=1 Tax=Verrucomicrobium sp. BvORR034 TaxID=1396418 RepID=UPI002240EDDA|nr:hypothetical protein [Verrucomicrobium sp. BvORR034]